jgi:hypothetical protein
MKLPRAIATIPPGQTGSVRARDIGALTDVGDAEFRAIQQAGGAIQKTADVAFQAWENRRALDDQQKIGEINQKAEESDILGIREVGLTDLSAIRPLPDSPDYFNGSKILDSQMWAKDIESIQSEHKKRITSLASGIKDPDTRQRWITKQLSRSNIGKIARAKYDEYQKGVYLENAKTAAGNGDMETADQWIDIAEKHLLLTHKEAMAAKENNVKNYITGLYRTGLYDEARRVLEKSSLSETKKENLDDEIDSDEKASLINFEDSINTELVRIDNTPNMTQGDFNTKAELMKARILTADLPGTKKKKMLSDLEKWRRGTNEIDYAKILSLNQEMDAAQRSGIVDPTIKDRIMRASLEGVFGGRHKGGQKTYGDMIRRFEKLQFDERLQATAPIVRTFERENADDPRLIFLFHEAKNKFIAEHPDIDTKELFIKISGLAESYSILPESAIVGKLKSGKSILMTSPDGKQYRVPVNKRQKFLDNGFTE